MALEINSSEEQFRAKYQEEAKKIGRFNLAIFGKTGVGKSTLINAVFGEEVAPTGIGKPVTQDRILYHSEGAFFGLYDTRGIEIGQDSDKVIKELGGHIKELRLKPESEQVHVAWYCVRSNDRRFEDTEADFIRRLHELGLPVIVVLTQVPSRDGELHGDARALSEHITSLGLPIEGDRPIPVMAAADDFTRQESHGLRDLLDATFRAAPDGVAKALGAAQKIDLQRKWIEAQATIGTAALVAGGIGAAPIPFADAPLIVAAQLGLMARIAAIYGVEFDKASVAAIAATAVATQGGKALVVGLLKLIPGAGPVVGGVISAGTALSFTTAMGYAWAAVCSQLSQGKFKSLDDVIDSDAVKAFFEEQLKSWLKNPLGDKARPPGKPAA